MCVSYGFPQLIKYWLQSVVLLFFFVNNSILPITLLCYTIWLQLTYFVPKIVAYFMKQYLKWVGEYLHEYWHSSSLYHIRPKSTHRL